MDDQKRTRLTNLLHRQSRAARTAAVLGAWRDQRVSATALVHERTEEVISWLRANWRQPDQSVANLEQPLQAVAEDVGALVVLDFWRWDEAVAVLVPGYALLRLGHRLQKIYPDGFLAIDQAMTKALIVDFDEHTRDARISQIGWR